MIPFVNLDLIRRTRRDGDTWVLTEHGWPVFLIGVVMLYIMIDSYYDATQHDAEAAPSPGHHAAAVGGDAAEGTASGTLAFTFFFWPWIRRTTLDRNRGVVTKSVRWAWVNKVEEFPLDDVAGIALTASNMHAYASLVRKDGQRVKLYSAFRVLFFLGGVPRRLKLAVEDVAADLGVPIYNEYAREYGPGWMGRLFGGS